MESASDSPPSLQIPELLEKIVAFLDDDRAALRACASSSRMITFVAQRLLFRSISFSGKQNENYISPRRLRTILADSPHLARYIRRISINLNNKSNADIARLGLTHVEDIRVSGIAGGGRNLHKPTLEAVRRVIGLESIRSVQVDGSYRDPRLLGRLFGECTPNLGEVEFYMCGVKGIQYDEDLANPPAVKTVRTQLTSLRLLDSSRMAAWLMERECPFDISQLVDVDVTGSIEIDGYTHLLLERTRPTIQRLGFSMLDIEQGPYLNPTRFPSVTHLTVESPMDYLPKFPPAMAGVDSHNIICEIVFTSRGFDERPWASATEQEWAQELAPMLREFDAALAALPLPELKRVEIQVQQKTGDNGGEVDAEVSQTAAHTNISARRTKASLLKEWLPILVSRGLLVVTSY
ncbi:hypothetical protein MVEN_01118000 [Mycena venus]|uniref:Uncharacterized protein n=1 Tax=Mycena venus TaxID=2733690 RepID=A0A8H7CZW8_9AGAR|nr:hypothetical protein MVEN_01118000 [Mycena venus]